MIRWFVKNDLAANLLMVAILLAGGIMAFTKIPLEVRPTREYAQVRMSIPYRGASPAEIERQVLIPIEQSLLDLSGVREITSSSTLGSGSMTVRMKDGVDPKDKLAEIERRVRGIRSIPSEVEAIRYSIPDTSNYFEVISIVVQARNDGMSMQELTEHAFSLKESVLALPEVTRAVVIGTNDREFSIRLDQQKFQSYGLSFESISRAIQNNSQEVGAGSLKYETGRVTLRPGKTALTEEDFRRIQIPVGRGETVTLGEIAEVHDGFTENVKEVEYNGRPCLIVEVLQTREQSALKIADAVKEFVAQKEKFSTESGLSYHIWDDESYSIKGRLQTLSTSLLQGGVLVMLVLGLFLRPSLAFWVVLGIPVSFAGGLIFMPLFGITANMMSVFAFILVLGIVVDDAIVTGENIFQKMQKNEPPLEAAVKGTKEVATPVIFGVLTTIVAFLPLFSFTGEWGILAKQIPPVVIPVLLFSLIESKLILPSHLKHLNLSASSGTWYNVVPDWFNRQLSRFSFGIIKPLIAFGCRHRYATLAVFIAMILSCIGYWQSGKMGFQVFPTVDSLKMSCKIVMPTNTIYKDTKRNVNLVYKACEQLREEFRDGEGEDAPSLIGGILASTGGHFAYGFDEQKGYVVMEILPPKLRKHNFVENSVIEERLRELCGEMSEVQALSIRSQIRSRSNSDEPDPLNIVLKGKLDEENEDVLEEIKNLVREEAGEKEFSSLYHNRPAGKPQLSINLNEEGHRLGLTQSDLARQIRGSIIGREITRIPRNTGEIRVFLKLPSEIQEDRYALEKLTLNLNNGETIPLKSVADVSTTFAPTRIERTDGAAVTKIIGSPRDKNYDLVKLAERITPELNRITSSYPGLNWVFDGYLADYKEIRQRFGIGLIALIFTLFALLALPFNSLLQPLYVIMAIPFGIIGAFLGHIIMDITPSYMSMFGLLALTGVVINDSLILVDTINTLRKNGTPLKEAVLQGVTSRVRPILLTSFTTFSGLIPLMFADSLQAQFLIPMAVSLGYGILFATFVTLALIPCILLISEDLQQMIKSAMSWWMKPFRKSAAEG